MNHPSILRWSLSQLLQGAKAEWHSEQIHKIKLEIRCVCLAFKSTPTDKCQYHFKEMQEKNNR